MPINSNKRRLFTGQFKPTSFTLENTEGLTVTTKLVGTLRLVPTDDRNEHHVYTIPQFIYDTNIPPNILSVPALSTFFG